MTMRLVSTTTLAAGASGITFGSIPASGTDLLVLISARSASTTNSLNLGINNEAVSVTGRRFTGFNTGGNVEITTTTTASGFAGYLSLSSDTAGKFGNTAIYIHNYSSSLLKSISSDSVSDNNGTTSFDSIFALLWNSTDAVNQIRLFTSGNLATGTTVSLYTISKGSGGATAS